MGGHNPGAWSWLQHDHTHIWVVIQDFEGLVRLAFSDSDPHLLEEAYDAFRQFADDLMFHFDREEGELFRTMIATAPETKETVAALEAEHVVLRDVLGRVLRHLEAARDSFEAAREPFFGELARLLRVLRTHSDAEWELVREVVLAHGLGDLLGTPAAAAVTP